MTRRSDVRWRSSHQSWLSVLPVGASSVLHHQQDPGRLPTIGVLSYPVVVPRDCTGYIGGMTNTEALIRAAALAVNDASDLCTLKIQLVNEVTDQGYGCPVCVGVDHPIQAEVYYGRNDVDEAPVYRESQQMCLACVIPFIAQVDYLDADAEVIVEVTRGALGIPF